MSFLIDRIVRLGPQLYLYLGLTYLLTFVGLRHLWLTATPDPVSALEEFLVLPMDPQDKFGTSQLMPQAWSLGLEGYFYLCFPFLLIFRARRVAALLSFATFLLSYFQVLDLNMGYYMLPGVLFIFICGSWIASPDSRLEAKLPAFFAAAAAVLLAASYLWPEVCRLHHRPVLAGLIGGVTVVSLLHRLKLTGKLDAIAGNLSYGVFLNHWLILAALGSYAEISIRTLAPLQQILWVGAVCLAATLLSAVSYRFLEAPLLAWRRKRRDAILARRAAPAPAAPRHEALAFAVDGAESLAK